MDVAVGEEPILPRNWIVVSRATGEIRTKDSLARDTDRPEAAPQSSDRPRNQDGFRPRGIGQSALSSVP